MLYALAYLTTEQCPRNALLNLGIISAWSCGIYLQGARNVDCIVKIITGQSDEGDTLIPKGAVALNGCRDIALRYRAEGNRQNLVIVAVGAHLPAGRRGFANITATLVFKNAVNAHIDHRPLVSLGDIRGVRLRSLLSGSGNGLTCWEVADVSQGLANIDFDMMVNVTGDAVRVATSFAIPLRDSRFAGTWTAGGLIWRTNDGRNLKRVTIAPANWNGKGAAGYVLHNAPNVTLNPLIT